MAEIWEAFHRLLRVATGQTDESIMSIPARRGVDADLVVADALDELERLRAEVRRLQGELP